MKRRHRKEVLIKNISGRCETRVEVGKIETFSELVDQARPVGRFQLLLKIIDIEPEVGRKSKTSTILKFDFYFFFHRENCSETAAEKFRAELKPESQQS